MIKEQAFSIDPFQFYLQIIPKISPELFEKIYITTHDFSAMFQGSHKIDKFFRTHDCALNAVRHVYLSPFLRGPSKDQIAFSASLYYA